MRQDNIEAVAKSGRKNTTTSTRYCSLELYIPRTSLRWIKDSFQSSTGLRVDIALFR